MKLRPDLFDYEALSKEDKKLLKKHNIIDKQTVLRYNFIGYKYERSSGELH